MRDAKRSRCYKAESKYMWEGLGTLNPKLATKEDVQAFALKVLSSKTAKKWRPLIKPERIKFYWSGKRGSTHAGHGAITFADWAFNKACVLHEVAHTLDTAPSWGDNAEPGHGLTRRRIYYDLVYTFGEPGAYKVLREGFKQQGLTYTAPRPKRVLTPEQKEALTEQLLAAASKRQK